MNDAGQGLLSRLGGVKRELSDNSTRPVSLSSSEYSKLRKALEKHFPDTAGLESVRQGHTAQTRHTLPPLCRRVLLMT